MKRKIFKIGAVLLSSSILQSGQLLFAQTSPGTGPSAPSQSGTAGPTVPQPEPGAPRQMEPTIPGKPAPSGPQKIQPNPGVGEPLPGQTGTIPERVLPPPSAGGQQTSGALSSDQIKKVQEALKAKGMNPGTMSGMMDPTTQQALRDFQKANNLPVTGVLDRNTADKLGVTMSGTSTPNPTGSSPRTNSVVP